MFYSVLARQVKYFKETEGGREIMCQAFEDLAEQRVTEEKKAFARRLIVRGKQTLEEIAEDTDLPIEEVRKLAENFFGKDFQGDSFGFSGGFRRGLHNMFSWEDRLSGEEKEQYGRLVTIGGEVRAMLHEYGADD